MSPRARTNQLLYQVELLVGMAKGDDEHAQARQMALEEGALALFELALNSLLKEVTEHARLENHAWRRLLADDGPQLAELQRLRDVMNASNSWLGWLVSRLEQLHGSEGAARRAPANPAMIAVGGQVDVGTQLLACLDAAKRETAALRETSLEW
ncbi:hypothetical protein HW452_12335 [Halomonas aquamarina]|uniref:Uncharacterized protein n=1 Tax=Vreelandella aquamarina TaxID=77097 RepID=A0ACC5VVT3_9GAMM|nr:DUF6586 family protein [Halomonas aquamarina]MBZ5488311.1 hypothetical protein [Halomonas aquamarina]